MRYIDIVSKAPERFKQLYDRLESEEDTETRSKIALEYIRATFPNSLDKISYSLLGDLLRAPESVSVAMWRKLYALERSIPPRGIRRSWLDRLTMFYDTYLLEKTIVADGLAPTGGKFYFLKGSKKDPVDHDALHAGKGRYLADLYYYDDSISGSQKDKMVPVEVKYNPYDSLNDGIEYYRNHHNYGVRHIMLFDHTSGKFYFISYDQSIKIIDQPNIKKPESFIDFEYKII